MKQNEVMMQTLQKALEALEGRNVPRLEILDVIKEIKEVLANQKIEDAIADSDGDDLTVAYMSGFDDGMSNRTYNKFPELNELPDFVDVIGENLRCVERGCPGFCVNGG